MLELFWLLCQETKPDFQAVVLKLAWALESPKGLVKTLQGLAPNESGWGRERAFLTGFR